MPATEQPSGLGRAALRVLFVPGMYGLAVLGCFGAYLGGWATLAVPGLLLVAIGVSLVVERLIPYEEAWNNDHGDAGRDVVHAFVNESLLVMSVFAIPALTFLLGDHAPWPRHANFALQVLMALLLLDLGITVLHVVSHRVGWLWRLHAVHHSVTRMYGFNGLMKHPLHQLLETGAGALPLVLLGVPRSVAAAAGLFVAVQLLLQHSNATYRVGPLKYLFSFNEGHRFHHLRWAGVGDVNFGLFTLVWDHLLGTFSYDPERRFTSADIGIDAWPNYPSRYVPQLRQPFVQDTEALKAEPKVAVR